MNSKLNLTLVIGDLSGGGAEKILLILAEGLVKLGHNVTILTLTLPKYVPDFYKIPEKITRIIPLPETYMSCKWYDFKCLFRRNDALAQTIEQTKPDIVISFLDVPNIKTLSALATRNIPVIVAEHTDPRFYPLTSNWKLLRWLWYPTASKVVMLTEETLKKWAQKFIPRWNTCAIPNPVLLPILSGDLKRPQWFNKKNIVAMGRLNHIKGFDKLIEAFNLISANFPDWNVTILGEGPMRKNLEELVKKYKLEDRVYLPGAINPPYEILSQADLFVMTSVVEGFPNAICEAMACGLPVISFDCPSGPRAIIRENIDGILINPGDIKSLAENIAKLILDEKQRLQMAKNAKEILVRLSLEKYLFNWEVIIFEALKKDKLFKFSTIWKYMALIVDWGYKLIFRKFYLNY